jgi:hypothetical protein
MGHCTATTLSFAALVLLGCGGSKAEAPAPESPASSESTANDSGEAAGDEASEASDEEDGPLAIPTECASDGDVCTPSRKFVEALCQDVYPAVALLLFRQGSPWTRGYLTRKTEAWNATGGASVSGWLEFDE